MVKEFTLLGAWRKSAIFKCRSKQTVQHFVGTKIARNCLFVSEERHAALFGILVFAHKLLWVGETLDLSTERQFLVLRMPGGKEQSWNPVRILSVLYHCVHSCPSFHHFCSLVSFSGTTFSPKGWRSRQFRPNHQVFPLWCWHLVPTVASGRDCPLQ